MKKIMYATLTLSLLFCCTLRPSTAGNYDVSVLYLKIFDGSSFKVILNKTPYNNESSTHILESVHPGKHLLRIMSQSPDNVETVIFNGYISIPPKKIIFAFIDRDGIFRIACEKNTKTVHSPPSRFDTNGESAKVKLPTIYEKFLGEKKVPNYKCYC